MLDEESLRKLADSIGRLGLLDPIVVTPEGLVLDGRNRLAGCELAGVEPTFVTYDGDPDEYVIAKADDRRHMTTGQRAMAVATNLARRGMREKGRWKRGSVPAAINGSVNSAWQQRLNEAGLIIDHAAELAPLVVAGATDSVGVWTLDRARKAADQARRTKQANDDALAVLPDDLRVLVREGLRELTDAQAEASLRLRIASLDTDLAERVTAGALAIDSAETSMRERVANLTAQVADVARSILVLTRMAGYPLPPALVEGYDRPPYGRVNPLDADDIETLRRVISAIERQDP